MFRFRKHVPKRATLESQLDVLATCGIRMRGDRSVDELLESWDREDFESEPYRMLLVALGSEMEEPPLGRCFSDDICWFDTECIEDHGDYARIANRLATLAKGDLPISDVRDHVEIDGGEVWLEFRLDERPYRFEPTIDDDWVDPAIFDWFASLLADRNVEGEFKYLDLGGQDCLIGYATRKQIARLNKETGLTFVPISEAV